MELKPCPFCGGEPELTMEDGDCNIHCTECGGQIWSESRSEAIEKWNARATPERVKACWIYRGLGYKDQTRQLDIERFVCGNCFKQQERVERRWWNKLTPPKKKFCATCGAEMDTVTVKTWETM